VDGLIPLYRLATGQFARIGRVVGRPDHVHRLEEFGLRGGTQIQMFRPGNPCIIRLSGNKVCLRSDEFLNVLVKPLGSGDAPSAPCPL
jgi:Fe2+ transport system protein FeoA